MTTLAQLIRLGVRPGEPGGDGPVEPAADFTVNSADALTALIAEQTVAGLSGRVVILEPGDYGSTIYKGLVGFQPADRVILRSASRRGTRVPGFALSNTKRVTFEALDLHRTRANDTDVDYNAAVMWAQNAEDCWLDDCEISSDPLIGVDFTGYVPVSGGSGTFIDGEPVSTSSGGKGVFRIRPNSSSSLFAITGIKTLPANPLRTVAGSRVVTVIDVAHNHADGADVTVRDATAVGGITPNGTFPITYVSPDSYSFEFTDAATTTASGGGLAVRVAVDDMSGNASGGALTAWSGKVLTGEISGATRTIGAIATNTVPDFCYDLLDGVGPGSGLRPSNGLRVENCYLHDLSWPVNTSGAGMRIRNNRYEDVYNSFGNYVGHVSDFEKTGNRGINVWASDTDGQPSGTGGPHSSLFALTNRGFVSTGGRVEANAFAVGVKRSRLIGGYGYATGPKQKDMPNPVTASIAGDELTVTAGSQLSTSTPLAAGQRVFATGGVGVDRCYVLEQISSSEAGGAFGMRGKYRISLAQTVASRAMYVAGYYDGFDFLSNLFVSNASIGLQFSATINGRVAYNTLVADRSSNAATNKPSLYYCDWLEGSRAQGNVVFGFANGFLPGGNDAGEPIDPSWIDNSFENVVALQSSTGVAGLEGLFSGPAFTIDASTTIEDILEMFSANPAGRIHGRAGHDAYYDWDRNVASYPAEPEKPAPSVATGVDLPVVTWPGGTSQFTRASKGAPATLWGMANPVPEIFFTLDASLPSNGTASKTLLAATNALSLTVQGSTSAHNLLRLTIGAVGVAVTIDSSLPFLAAADPLDLTKITFTADFDAYEFYLQIGDRIDPFVSVTNWSGAGMPGNVGNMTLLAGTTTTPAGTAASVGQLVFHDEFLDLGQVANQDKLVAQDGRTADYGANGENLFGVPPRAFAKGNAAAWGDGAGLNLGSGPQKFIAPTDPVDA